MWPAQSSNHLGLPVSERLMKALAEGIEHLGFAPPGCQIIFRYSPRLRVVFAGSLIRRRRAPASSASFKSGRPGGKPRCVPVLYATNASREREVLRMREDRSLQSGFLSWAICAKGHDPPRAGGSACRAHPPPGQGGSLPHGAPRTCESAPLISFIRVSALHTTTPGPLRCCKPRSMILVNVAGREI